MLTTRTNAEWITALSGQGRSQAEAIGELRELLLRAALYTLVTHLDDLQQIDENDRVALAEDCAQDAVQAVLARLDDFRGESKFTTWAYKFGVNMALTRARRERWKPISLDALSEQDDTLDWLQWQESLGAENSELPALQEEVGRVIREVIRTELTDRQRQVLKWIAFDDVPMDVVVERLASNRNAIYKMLHDARLKVKRQLAAHGYEVADVYDLFRSG
ncbi:MAG TPA: sigma-70 family RNA polymerase sigma factor [Anaerolineaceae bacterium]|nr:sigma-70 family RNA polymerase sigma factor [Anaerolineaceae bacterium]